MINNKATFRGSYHLAVLWMAISITSRRKQKKKKNDLNRSFFWTIFLKKGYTLMSNYNGWPYPIYMICFGFLSAAYQSIFTLWDFIYFVFVNIIYVNALTAVKKNPLKYIYIVLCHLFSFCFVLSNMMGIGSEVSFSCFF